MAKGKWSTYHPKVRCRYCGYVIKGEIHRIDGYKPCCLSCFPKRNLTLLAADDATRTPTTELTTTDDRIYSTEATGATPRRR